MGGAQSSGGAGTMPGESSVQLAVHPAPPFAALGRTTPPGTETSCGLGGSRSPLGDSMKRNLRPRRIEYPEHRGSKEGGKHWGET